MAELKGSLPWKNSRGDCRRDKREFDEECVLQIQKEEWLSFGWNARGACANRVVTSTCLRSEGYTTMQAFYWLQAGRLLATGESIEPFGSRSQLNG